MILVLLSEKMPVRQRKMAMSPSSRGTENPKFEMPMNLNGMYNDVMIQSVRGGYGNSIGM
jgi:hypothetical protein